MKHRFEWQSLVPLCILPALLIPQNAPVQDRDHPSTIATIQVLVRNREGVAVGGLTAGDFVVTERGRADRIDSVQSFVLAPAARAATSPSAAASDGDMLSHWKAFAVVRVNAGEAKYVPLQIAPAEIRGSMAYGKLSLSRMHLDPGPYPVTVLFEFKDKHSRKQQMFLESEPVIILP